MNLDFGPPDRGKGSAGGRSAGPRARTCPICGRQTLIAGYQHHVSQCGELFLKREALKPPKERRALPIDPYASIPMGSNITRKELDEMNAMTQQVFTQTLAPCAFCGRKFLPEKLVIHNKSCRADNPAKQVGEVGGRGRLKRESSDGINSSPMAYEGSPSEFSRPASGKAQASRTSSDQSYSSGGTANRTGIFHKVASSSTNPFGGGGIGGAVNNFEGDSPSYIPLNLSQCPHCGRTFNEVAYDKHVKICKKVFLEKRKVYDSAKHRAADTELAEFQNRTARRRKSVGGGESRIGGKGSVRVAGGGGVGRVGVGRVGVGGGVGGGGAMGNTRQPQESNSSSTSWKAKSEAFRRAMKEAKRVSRAQEESKRTGIPLHQLLPPPSSSSSFGGGGSQGGGGGYDEYADYIQCPTCGRRFNQKAGERHIPQCKNIIAKPSVLFRGSGFSATTSRAMPSSANSRSFTSSSPSPSSATAPAPLRSPRISGNTPSATNSLRGSQTVSYGGSAQPVRGGGVSGSVSGLKSGPVRRPLR